MIDGEHITKDDTFDSINPANTSELIAKVSKATKEDVDKAFESSNKAYKAWRQWSHKDACSYYALQQLFAVVKRKSLQSWYETVNLGMRLLAMQQKVSTLSNTMRSMMELADGKPVLIVKENITNSINQLVLVLQFHLELPFAIMVQH